MKKIISILALLVMVSLLASCWGNKEWSESEEQNEWVKIESSEKTVKDTVVTPKKESVTTVNVKDSTKIPTISWSTSKNEDQVVKDFEKELDWLFKLLETNAK